MTDTPFASVPTLRDAEPALPPPAQATATSALAVTSSGQGAFSSPPHGYLDERRVCAFCGVTFFRYRMTSAEQWSRRVSCTAKQCLSIREALRQRQPASAESCKPQDKGREAELYRGLSYEDDPRAVRPEIRFTKLPEPQHSPSGNGTAMCASARRT